ncbi:LPXTG cell wall anchor domain-containing protein [Amycolatopsis circi]|uniref:LPXTG cell wall anchor domain-containing protein n=1 Tax=Amycolatopsis circi TaxID=871959 RepID=UPI000E2777D5|nr:LPXTG cell wall anchor domain-containing protein [Amycolatopsis circi]
MPIPTKLRAGFAVAAVAGLALLGTATSAFACTTGDHRGNPVPGTKITDCSKVEGVSGSKLDEGDLKFTGGNGEKSLTITEAAEGVTVQAIVVVGGDDGHSVYVPGAKKLPKVAPWTDLVAPHNHDGSQPNIDRWFACGVKTAPTKPPVTDTPTSPAKPTSSAPTAAPTSVPSSAASSAAPTTTSAPAAVPAGNQNGTGGGLANTGFDNAWLFWIAGVLIVGGGALLVLLKLRRRGTN